MLFRSASHFLKINCVSINNKSMHDASQLTFCPPQLVPSVGISPNTPLEVFLVWLVPDKVDRWNPWGPNVGTNL